MPTEVVHAPGHERTRSLGWLATAWMEALIIHGPGDIEIICDAAGVGQDMPCCVLYAQIDGECYSFGTVFSVSRCRQ